jgi:hypothetical protein
MLYDILEAGCVSVLGGGGGCSFSLGSFILFEPDNWTVLKESTLIRRSEYMDSHSSDPDRIC